MMLGVRALPEWLSQNGYQSPSDPRHCPWQLITGSSANLFEWLQDHPQRAATFDHLMVGLTSETQYGFDIYPVQDKLLTGFSGGVLLVDVGGGRGHDLERFHERFPEAGGQLILQDRPNVVSNTSLQEPLKAMAHDFFSPQPIKGSSSLPGSFKETGNPTSFLSPTSPVLRQI